jgi:hypothetical protein
MFLAQSDISSVPADDVKSTLIVIGFLVTLGMNALALLMGVRTQKRVVSGRMETTPTVVPADKSEVEDELDGIMEKIEELKTSLHQSVQEITSAGQRRADSIGRKIDEEVRAIRADVESRLALVHEKVNVIALQGAGHAADIAHLKSRDYSHDQSIAGLQSRSGPASKAR